MRPKKLKWVVRQLDWQVFRNIHQGSNIIVCGCGSSLTSLKHPSRYTTIGVNDVGRLFTPNYLVALNPPHQYRLGRYHYVQHSRCKYVFSQLPLPLKYSQLVKTPLGVKAGADFPQTSGIHYTQNSPYFAVCLAAFMGAKRIGLIGVDLTDNHFFADTGQHVLQKKVQQIDQEYGVLYQSLQSNGIELFNLSQDSALTSLPKQSLVVFDANRSGKLQSSTSNTENQSKAKVVTVKQALNIVHVGLTNCAGALWNLHNMLNRYTPHHSRVITASQITNGRRYPRDVLLNENNKVQHLLASADIVHFHNWLDKDSPQMKPFRSALKNKPAVLQYHSEPEVLKHAFPGRDLLYRNDITTLVVAQKQARLFPNAIAVPNALDVFLKDFSVPPLTKQTFTKRKRMKVLYAPTDINSYPDYAKTCRGKGYKETSSILSRLEQQKLIRAFTVTNMSWQKLCELRRQVDLVIDECVTGGYHLTSLEALAQGCITCAYLDPTTIQLLSDITGSNISELPWQNTPIDSLEVILGSLANQDLTPLKTRNRQWMIDNWAPEKVLSHYTQIYYQEIYGHQTKTRDGLLSVAPTKTRTPIKTEIMCRKPIAPVRYQLTGKKSPRTSDEFAQTISLSRKLLYKRNSWRQNVCHIIGNGPSVTSTELSLIAQNKIISVNAASLLHKSIGRDADFYCVSDRRFLTDARASEYLGAAKGSHHVYAGYCDTFHLPDEVDFVRIRRGDGISTNISFGFHHNCSVMLFASQLALYLGCRTLFWHGCEFDYTLGRFDPGDTRKHDTGTFPRVKAASFKLANILRSLGGQLNIVGPSKLVGDFGEQPISNIRSLTVDDFHQQFSAQNHFMVAPSK